jgi:hypothetical protein
VPVLKITPKDEPATPAVLQIEGGGLADGKGGPIPIVFLNLHLYERGGWNLREIAISQKCARELRDGLAEIIAALDLDPDIPRTKESTNDVQAPTAQ